MIFNVYFLDSNAKVAEQCDVIIRQLKDVFGNDAIKDRQNCFSLLLESCIQNDSRKKKNLKISHSTKEVERSCFFL